MKDVGGMKQLQTAQGPESGEAMSEQHKDAKKREKAPEREIKLVPAARIHVKIGQDLLVSLGSKDRLRTSFIGMKDLDYMILQLPVIPGILDSLSPGTRIKVRYLIEGRVYGFSSDLIGHVIRPKPVMFISFPYSVEELNLRACDRVDTFLPVEAKVGEAVFQGKIRDLSCGGCWLVVDEPEEMAKLKSLDLAQEDKATLVFSLFDKDDLIAMETTLVKVVRETRMTGLALQFADGQPDAVARVTAYVEALMEPKGKEY